MTLSMINVPADPAPYEFDPARTALVCIDFQRDFVEPGGFGETLGSTKSRWKSMQTSAVRAGSNS